MTNPDPLFSVADQVVLVSGASRGIGQAVAAGFASRGARVYISGREDATLASAIASMGADADVHAFVCDVAQEHDILRLVEHVLSQAGRIDTLVNVAGVNRRMPALQVTAADFDFIFNINLKGAFLLSQAVGRLMIDQGSGSQINIASLNTERPLSNVAPYAMSKSALAQMTRALALEWGPQGVRVNALAPGFILTDLTHRLWANPQMDAWGKTHTPQRRLGTPADLVGTAIFLASPASAFMTGQVLYVDGGFTAGWDWPIPGDAQSS